MSAPWLSLIGLGEDGANALTPAARAIVARASLIIGGARHLAMIDAPAERLQWPSPLADALPRILAQRGKPTVVLASGDPFFYGVGDLIARHVAPDEIFCVPAPSAFSLAAARLKWSQQDCALLSLHGRAFERVRPHLQPNARMIALSWDETTPARLARHLALRGMGGSRLHVLERLGGPLERVRQARADAFALDDIAPLNTVAVEVEADGDTPVIPLTPGLPDDWFEHDGQLTKRDIRAVTLAALAPRKGELLWDVGAGAGSIAIEWMLSDPSNRAIAIERDAVRAERIARNALSLGVPDLRIIKGEAPQALAELDAPHAAFIGGGADAATLAAAWDALPRFGRIVVNAVTIETQALLADAYREKGGELLHLQIAHARPIGRFHALDPAMAVTQWRATKR
ncbi:bifunctional cobalt-precorrin-7 (C(5))-methyltransferase/cobalt-precorrin-6B (C(15))-methyltransferase [Methylocystis sp. SC2]|uniref:bifunctional cobalt-precorrin-7 (C(5))-methyltransferase/cobalt-precorrin-6B (C(15))-methyltransferase n=1 Tax=Methylocystis sp. (strain SC2) TaxID=187303 RepID=UPI00027AE986|nr:bifunctional cobalt-precorrin-7 (C(5))-methyltransferase/cobalt-precorrin-6B (C(15))-methyltransferase [Methylocystis sp. SC2]CCJ08568.1 Precorrin-6y C5,15-methyltransferase (Decarboxylating), CbiE subunit [Methylocystis sp. SC2]